MIGRPVGTVKSLNAMAHQHLQNKLRKADVLLRPDESDDARIYRRFSKFTKYQNDPVAFCYDVLKVEHLWEKQIEILEELNKPPHRVLCAASHAVGKSFISACYVLFTFFCFPDSITITTAPTQRQVEDVLWRQIRSLNIIDPKLFRGQHKPRLEISKTWYAMGFTPNSGDALQGIHPKSGTMTIVFDEAVGIPREIWEACNGLDNDDVRWLCIFNPTETTCQAFVEWQDPRSHWKNITISGMEHPNIEAELLGLPPIVPGAIRLNHYNDLLVKWSEPVQGTPHATDVEWPPKSGIFLRPNTLAQSRCLGQFPIVSLDTVWNAQSIDTALTAQQEVDANLPIEIGVDVARKGDDYSVICVRRGNCCLDLQRRNGLLTQELFGEIKNTVRNIAIDEGINEKSILIKVDVTGIGWGVFDMLYAENYNAIDIDFGSRAIEYDKYPNKRCELHFQAAEKAQHRQLDLTRIDKELHPFIRKQALGMQYEFDGKGRRQLESKKTTKAKLKMSPDDLDAIALAFYDEIETISVAVEYEDT